MESTAHLKLVVIALICILGLGTIGYVFTDHLSPLEAFYMTVITISTVGLEVVKPLTTAGRMLTILIILLGVVTTTFAIREFGQIIIERQLKRILGKRTLKKQIYALKNHFIVCGFGRMGRMICDELKARKTPFVLIDVDSERTSEAESNGFLYVLGDASDEAILESSGIEKAKGLVTVLPSDADNVFVTLTARGLNEKIVIVARAEESGTEGKLYRAGATRVVSPHVIGAHRITQILTRPTVVDFLEIVTRRQSLELEMEEITIIPPSDLIGKSLQESEIRKKVDVIIIAIKRANGEMVFSPSSSTKIHENDTLVIIGKREATEAFTKIMKKEIAS